MTSAPSRSDLSAHPIQTLSPGGWSKAALRVVDLGGRRAMLKDFAGKAWPVRLIGRLHIRRELRAYERLAGVDGVPSALEGAA